MRIFDAHVHYSEAFTRARFLETLERNHIERCAIACIHEQKRWSVVPAALRLKADCPPGKIYVHGSLERAAWFALQNDPDALGRDLVRQGEALLAAGCDGVKLLEGKPDYRKEFPVPDFDSPAWEPFWSWAEQKETPIVWHVNDPPDFWDASKINPYARSRGWFYGEGFIHNEEQYRQIGAVLDRHPALHIQFAHMLFLSASLDRLAALLRRCPNLRVDLAPGIELFEDMSKTIEAARAFFEEFGDRILFGSDIGSRPNITDPPGVLDFEESAARHAMLLAFLATPFGEAYTQQPDGKYLYNIDPIPMRGLGLGGDALDRVLFANAARFLGAPRPVDLTAVNRLESDYRKSASQMPQLS